MRPACGRAGPAGLLSLRIGALALVGAGFARTASALSANELEFALAQVVDSPLMPEEAAAIEERPYRLLLEKVRLGPDQRTLASLEWRFTYEGLRSSPDRFRGRIVYDAACTIAEIRRSPAPGAGRFDRDEVYAGVAANVDGRTGRLRLWAFRFLRRPGDALVYPGDRVNIAGYFLKNVPLLDASGEVHWMPLLVGPWPTYTGRWWPASALRRICPGLLPSREIPHEELRSRAVLSVLADGAILLGGRALSRERAVAELRRSAHAHPRRAVVAEFASPGARELAQALLDEAGVEKVAWKELGDSRLPPPGT